MIPKVIHQTAKTKNTTWEEGRLSRRLRKILSDWEYHLWDDQDNDRLLAEGFPQHVDAYRRIRHGVLRADIARCVYMHLFGGFYFDSDYRLFRSIPDAVLSETCILPHEWGSIHLLGHDGGTESDWEKAFRLGNSVFGSRPGYGFWSDFINYVFEEKKPDQIVDATQIPGISGPYALTRYFLQNRRRYKDAWVPEAKLFHAAPAYFGLVNATGGESYGVHLCWGSWRHLDLLGAAKTIARRKISAL